MKQIDLINEALTLIKESETASDNDMSWELYSEAYYKVHGLQTPGLFRSITKCHPDLIIRELPKVGQNFYSSSDKVKALNRYRALLKNALNSFLRLNSQDSSLTQKCHLTREMQKVSINISDENLDRNHEVVEKAWHLVALLAHECWLLAGHPPWTDQFNAEFFSLIFNPDKTPHLKVPNHYKIKVAADLRSWEHGFRLALPNSFRMIRNIMEHSKPEMSSSEAFRALYIADFYFNVLGGLADELSREETND